MQNLLFLIIGLAIGYYIKGKTAKTLVQKSADELTEIRGEAIGALKERTEGRKKEILDFMQSDARYGKALETCSVIDLEEGVTTLEIQELLGVSGDTARKYLNELEKEGKIEQIGSSGKGVCYKLK